MVNGEVRSKDDLSKIADSLLQTVSTYLWCKKCLSKYQNAVAIQKYKESEERMILILGTWFNDINPEMSPRRRKLVIDIHIRMVAKTYETSKICNTAGITEQTIGEFFMFPKVENQRLLFKEIEQEVKKEIEKQKRESK